MLGAGVVGPLDRGGDGIAVPGPKGASMGAAATASLKRCPDTNPQVVRNIPRPTEAIKIDSSLREKDGKLSFRFMEPLEESVYLDQVKLLAVDHPADVEVYPNEYFASNPPYPPFKVVFSDKNDARPPAGAWDEHGHDVLPDLLAHRYFGDFKVLPFHGIRRAASVWNLILARRTWRSAVAADAWRDRILLGHQHVRRRSGAAAAVCTLCGSSGSDTESDGRDRAGKWVRVVDDMGFPAGGPRTMTADLTGKLPAGTRRIRITTNLQIYWDNILISRTQPGERQESRSRDSSSARSR